MQVIGSDRFTLVIGLGKTGFSCARYLRDKGERFAMLDTRDNPPQLARFQQEFPGIAVQCGPLTESLLVTASRIVVSPGVARLEPAIVAAEAAGIEILGDIDLFCVEVQAPVIAITGSNAKSTVTTLVGEMAVEDGIDVGVGGNLGLPVLDLLLDGEKALYVLELSSFQLETTERLRAEVATILNVSADHMDRYASMADYHQAKQRIYRGCRHAVYNGEDLLTQPLLPENISQVRFAVQRPDLNDFGVIEHEGEIWLAKGLTPLMSTHAMALRGNHNVANALAALALGDAAGLSMPAMLAVLTRFTGLRHRCQWVRNLNGVDYYNDSKGTNVGATLAAIGGLGPTITGKIILIAGGDGKGADFSELAAPLFRWGRAALLIGRDSARIGAILPAGLEQERCLTLELAVARAAQLAHPGDIVLLSPACASFDMFTGFEQRGDHFMSAVEAL